MTETPLRNVLVDNGRYGQDAARVAEGTMPDGSAWRVSITDQNDGFTTSRSYGVVLGSHVANVHVSAQGAVISVTNENGMVMGPQGRAAGRGLVEALTNAIASGGISPEELNILSSPTESISNMASVAGRRSQTRGGGPDL